MQYGRLRKHFSVVSNQDFVVKDLLDLNNNWNIHLLSNTFTTGIDVESILRIYIPCHNRSDRKTWPFSKTGVSTKPN